MSDKDWHYKGYSGNPLPNEELMKVPVGLREACVIFAKDSFPKNAALTANAMITGMYLLLAAQGKIEVKK
jgi:hypothetical protein